MVQLLIACASGVSTSEPHLIMMEEPQSKFRFRYKSEMAGTHGQLKAERADRNKAIFPTVKVQNNKIRKHRPF